MPSFITHNTPVVDINGTSLQGYIQATRAQLVRVFGPPLDYSSDEEKVTTEWHLRFADGTVCTIYDWKRYSAGAPLPNELVAWHVGSTCFAGVGLVHAEFRKAHGLLAAA